MPLRVRDVWLPEPIPTPARSVQLRFGCGCPRLVCVTAKPGPRVGIHQIAEAIRGVIWLPRAGRVSRPAETRSFLFRRATKGEAPAGKPLHIVMPSKGPAHLGFAGCGLEAYLCVNAGRVRPESVIESTFIRMHGQHILCVCRQRAAGLDG